MKEYLGNRKEDIADIAKLGVKTFSFDVDDCRKYSLSYNNQMCPDYCNLVKINKDSNIKYQKCFFIGADKGRLGKLINIKKTLEKYRYRL